MKNHDKHNMKKTHFIGRALFYLVAGFVALALLAPFSESQAQSSPGSPPIQESFAQPPPSTPATAEVLSLILPER